MDEITFIETTKGKPLLVMNNYMFFMNRRYKTREYWECRDESCRARVITDNRALYNPYSMRSVTHDHDPPMKNLIRRQFYQKLKKDAKKNVTVPVPQIYRSNLAETEETVTEEIASSLPNFKSASSAMYRARMRGRQVITHSVDDNTEQDNTHSVDGNTEQDNTSDGDDSLSSDEGREERILWPSNRQADEAFIKLYQSEPCLWQHKNKDYHNQEKKDEAYQKLLKLLRETVPTATKDDVLKKINNLRTSYRRELRKIADSILAESDEVCKPTLWYYHLLTFLQDQEVSLHSDEDEPEVESNMRIKEEIVEEADSNSADSSTSANSMAPSRLNSMEESQPSPSTVNQNNVQPRPASSQIYRHTDFPRANNRPNSETSISATAASQQSTIDNQRSHSAGFSQSSMMVNQQGHAAGASQHSYVAGAPMMENQHSYVAGASQQSMADNQHSYGAGAMDNQHSHAPGAPQLSTIDNQQGHAAAASQLSMMASQHGQVAGPYSYAAGQNSFLPSQHGSSRPASSSSQQQSAIESLSSMATNYDVAAGGDPKRLFQPDSEDKAPDSRSAKRFRPCPVPEDRFDLTGKLVAMKLRAMPLDKSLMVEKFINDTLFDVEMGNLQMRTAVLPPSQYQQPYMPQYPAQQRYPSTRSAPYMSRPAYPQSGPVPQQPPRNARANGH